MTAVRLLSLLISGAIVGLAVPLAAASAASAAAWQVVSSPSPSQNNYSVLASVRRVPGTSQFWAVGYGFSDSNADQDIPIIEHQSGSGWTLVPAATPGGFSNTLQAVTVRSSTDAWAFGWQNNSDLSATHGLAEHYNGTAWSAVTLPSGISTLNGGGAFSNTDVVAVGQSSSGAVAVTWNGSKWTRVMLPTPALCTATNTYAVAISAVPGSSARYAVGDCSSSAANSNKGVLWHLSAGKWTITATFSGSLNDITPVSATNIWAVGSTPSGALLVHWNGTQWAATATPAALKTPGATLTGVIRVPGSQIVWAVGVTEVDYAQTPVAAEGPGASSSAWTVTDLPTPPQTFLDTVVSVAAANPTTVYAAGSYELDSSADTLTLVEHYG